MRAKRILLATAMLWTGLANAQSAFQYAENFNGETVFSLLAQGWEFDPGVLGGGAAGVVGGNGGLLDGDLSLAFSASATFNFTALTASRFYLVSFDAARLPGVLPDYLDLTFRGPGLFSQTVSRPLVESTFGLAGPGGSTISWYFGVEGSPLTAGDYSITFSNPYSFAANLSNPSRISTFTIDNLSIAAVPEPSTYAMLLASLSAIGFAARRRKFVSPHPALPPSVAT